MTNRDLEVTMLIATLFGYVEHERTTPKINKVRKQLRLGINKVENKRLALAITKANTAWENVKEQLTTPEAVAVSLSLMIDILYDMLEEPKKFIISEKNFYNATRSLSYGFTLEGDIETNTVTVSNAFRDGLGIKERASLSSLRLKISMLQKDKILGGS